MIHRTVALALSLVLLASPAIAGKRKVLVLPLDGSAPAETRTKLSASFQKMARVLEGEVQAGNTSLGDTATAIGCDPTQPACLENVRTTLGVDELVYGTADENGTMIVVVAKRYQKGKDPRALTVTQPASEPPSKIEAQLLPVFGNDPLPQQTDPPPVPPPGPTEPVTPVQQPETPESPEGASAKRDRNIAIGITAGGGVLVLLGLALWQQAGGLQDDIDKAMPRDQGDIDDLKATEDKASSRAWAGNICFVVGLGVAGYGAYRLYKWSKSEPSITVTPTPTEGGAAVLVGGRW
jgi:hypothetical protein